MSEVKKVTAEMRQKLRAPLSEDAIKPHPTKTYLSSIKAIYVTERMNDVFGVGSWSLKLDHITTTENGMVVIKTTFEIKEYGIYFECYGGNDNGGETSKNFDLGDAYKGATTDALTKIGSFLEIAIDVFKGKATHKETNADDNKPWLNKGTKEYDAVVKRLQAGTATAKQIQEHYKVSKTMQAELNTIILNHQPA